MKPRLPTPSEFYWFIRKIATHEDNDVGRLPGRHHGVVKGIIPAAYTSGNPKIQNWWESTTSYGSKVYKTVQMYGNRFAAPAASDSIAIGADPDGNKGIIGKYVNVGSAVVDADYFMGLRPVAPGNTLLLTANTERSTTSTTGEMVKRFFVTRPGKYRVKGELARSGGTATAYVAIERSDGTYVVASGNAESVSNYPTFGAQFTLDMTIAAPWGSFIAIILYITSGGTAYIQNVTVNYTDATAALGSTDTVMTD